MKITKTKAEKKQIVLLSLLGCPWCIKAKQFFKRFGVLYQEVDVSRDRKAQKECEKHGCRGAPVIIIDGQWFCGFDEKKMKKELGIKG